MGGIVSKNQTNHQTSRKVQQHDVSKRRNEDASFVSQHNDSQARRTAPLAKKNSFISETPSPPTKNVPTTTPTDNVYQPGAISRQNSNFSSASNKFQEENDDSSYDFAPIEEFNEGGNSSEPAFQMEEHIAACMCPIIVVDTKTNVHTLNSFGEELFGKSNTTLQGKNISQILSETSAGELQKRIRDFLHLRTKAILSEKQVYDIKEPKTPIKKVGARLTEMVKMGVPYFICYLQPEGVQKGSNFAEILKQQKTQNQENDSDSEDGDKKSEGVSEDGDKKSEVASETGEGEVQQQSFQFHSAVTQLSTIPIVSIDVNSMVHTWNPAAEHVFGFNASEIIGSTLTIIMPDDIAENHNSYVQRYIKTGVKRVVDKTRVVSGKRKSGEIFPVELKITEISDDKEQRMFLGFARDMTAVITKTEQYKHLAEQIFPASIASRVVNGDLIHDFHEKATILFCDIENFNQLSQEIAPKNLISFLDSIFEKFDSILKKYSLEKIKTIGDNCKFLNVIC